MVDFPSRVQAIRAVSLVIVLPRNAENADPRQFWKKKKKKAIYRRLTKWTDEIWWWKSERPEQLQCGFLFTQSWRLSHDEWTLLPFSAKLLVSNEVSKSRGERSALDSGTIFLKPLGGNSVSRSGRVNHSWQAALDFKDDLRLSGQNRGRLTWHRSGDKHCRLYKSKLKLNKIGTQDWWETKRQHNQTSTCAARRSQYKSLMNATLAKSLTAQGCKRVNYYRCSIITNHNLLGGPCVIYNSTLNLMAYISFQRGAAFPSQWNTSLTYLLIFFYYTNPNTVC